MARYNWPAGSQNEASIAGGRLAEQLKARVGLSGGWALDAAVYAGLAELLATTPEVLNVRAFGAVGNGVSDDTDAIEAAVAAVGVRGATIYFPVGHYRVTGTIVLPADRSIILAGEQQAFVGNPVDGAQQDGAVIGADFDGQLFTQAGTLSPRESVGLKMSRLTLYGDDNDVDLVTLTGLLDSVQFDDVYLRGTTGHGIVMAAVQNSWFRQCRILQCGDATHEAMKIDGSADGRSSLLLFSDCQWELNNGTALLLTNAGRTSGAGTENILITGGKFEHRAPYPCIKIVGTEVSQIRTHITTGGTTGVSGHDATGILIDPGVGNHNNARQILIDCTFYKSVVTETENARYFVDIVNGRDITVRGLFHNGAADSGAHIRCPTSLSASGACRIFVDPCNVYSTPISGVPIEGAHVGPEAVGEDRGDAGISLVAGVDAPIQRFETTLTQSRAVTLLTTAGDGTAMPWKGARFRIVRPAEGAFVLTVGAGPHAALSAGEWCDVQFDGTEWFLAAKGSLTDYASGASPENAGKTWLLGQRIYKTAPTAGDWIGWVVTAAGTTGTLSGVTGDITSGTDDLVVNDADDLEVGQRITIAGVTGTKRITAIVGTAVTIDSNADATVDDAAIAWSAPTFKEWGAIDA